MITSVITFADGTVATKGGTFRLGDRLIPRFIAYESTTAAGPRTTLLIQEIRGIPRLTRVSFEARPEGEEVRPKHLRAIEENLDDFVDRVVAIASQVILHEDGPTLTVAVGPNEARAADGIKAVKALRGSVRRPVTRERIERAARAYNSVQTGGLDAIATTLDVGRSTAATLLKRAREIPGLIVPVDQRGPDFHEGGRADSFDLGVPAKPTLYTPDELAKKFGWGEAFASKEEDSDADNKA